MNETYSVPKEEMLEWYRLMSTIRTFEEEAARLLGSGEAYGAVHQYSGEEAVAVGVCRALNPTDIITSTHRGHGHIIAKGGDVKRMMAELFGTVEGYCHGKGGSMHIASVDLGIYGANGIVGGGAGIAVGAALAARVKKTGVVSVCFFGDGGSNQGIVHEAMNLASIFKLPVIFVCENNQYAVSFSVNESTSVQNISLRAVAYGMPGITIDGMDVFAVNGATKLAVERARAGEGPSLIEAKTYRFHGHFSFEEMLLAGKKYRSDEEISEWIAKDPIEQLKRYMIAMKIATEKDLSLVEEGVGKQISEAVEYARGGHAAPKEAAFEDFYAVPYPNAVPRGW